MISFTLDNPNLEPRHHEFRILETPTHLVYKYFSQFHICFNVGFKFRVCHTENQQGKGMSVNILSRFQAGLPRNWGLIPSVDR
jgi:hypothetical protein